jgi:hypothetical protein
MHPVTVKQGVLTPFWSCCRCAGCVWLSGPPRGWCTNNGPDQGRREGTAAPATADSDNKGDRGGKAAMESGQGRRM